MKKQEPLFYFVKVKYKDVEHGKEYSYLCNDITIVKGDMVLVPRGPENEETLAVVTSAKFYTFEEAPFPVFQSKSIIGKLTSEESKQYSQDVLDILVHIKRNLTGDKEKDLSYLLITAKNYEEHEEKDIILKEISRLFNEIIDDNKHKKRGSNMNLNLSNTDITAVNDGLCNKLTQKGAKFYDSNDYEKAIEYYRLASAMGDTNAISNLGYCYLYGNGVEKNTDLAIQYFRISSKKGSIESIYKLADIYRTNKWGKEDKELATYYLELSLEFLFDRDDEDEEINFVDYPSLFFALGKEMMPDGLLETDLEFAFRALKLAEEGYTIKLRNGQVYYEDSYYEVIDLLQDELFDPIREDWELENCDEEDDDDDDIEF